MYDVSETWREIAVDPFHKTEISVVVGESGRLINEHGSVILFGGDAILVSQGGAEGGYRESQIISLETEYNAFAESHPSVGACLSAELSLSMLKPAGEIPRMGIVAPYVRLTDGVLTSEWIPQGKFYIDTREYSNNDDGLEVMTLHCFDAMLMTEQDYPDTTHAWPYTDADVVQEIADTIGVGVDPRTWDLMDKAYDISAPLGYSMREVLGNIGAMYAGNWVMNYDGDLLLIALNSFPAETNYIIDEYGDYITIGGDRLLVNFS